MKITKLPGRPPVEILLKRSPQARNYSLRVSGLDGRVTLTLPPRGRMSEALEFARSREDWIRRALQGQPRSLRVGFGVELPYQGRLLTIAPGEVRAARIEGGAILAPPDRARVGLRVETLLKAAARRRLLAASERYASQLGCQIGRLTLRDTRSRWGSCSVEGHLMYSWRLIMAPPEVLDYVAAHEVAHLVEMNHSQAFWDLVEVLCPTQKRHRAWLIRNGATLHRFRFSD